MARLQSVSEQFAVARRRTAEETQKAIVALAKREHAKILQEDPRPNRFRRWVDGREGAPEEAVKATGVILYRYDRLDLVVQYAMETLFQRSPVLSGEYRQSHTIFLHGRAVSNLKEIQPGDEVIISNPLPYSRKIEIGKMKMRVPGTSHVYEQAAKIVSRRWGNVALVKFTFQGLAGGGIIGGKPGNKGANRFPALSIKER